MRKLDSTCFKTKRKENKTSWETGKNCLRNVLYVNKLDNIDLNSVMSQQVQSSDAMNKAMNEENMI